MVPHENNFENMFSKKGCRVSLESLRARLHGVILGRFLGQEFWGVMGGQCLYYILG